MQLFGYDKLVSELMERNAQLEAENIALQSIIELHDLENNFRALQIRRLNRRIEQLENERASIAGGAIHPHGAIVVPMFHVEQAH